MYQIKTMNKISPKGLDRLPREDYTVGDDVANEDAILVRSAKLHDYQFPPNLWAIARAGAGTNNIPVDRCSEAGIVVFNTPGANANAVKELVLCALLAASRDVMGGYTWVREQAAAGADVAAVVEKGKSAFVGPELYRKTLGVIGLGAIGALVANIALSLGMEVYGYDPYLSVDAALRLDRHVHVVKEVRELYRVSDYVTIHMPYTNDTRHTINGDTIAAMKAEIEKSKAFLDSLKKGKVKDPECVVKPQIRMQKKGIADYKGVFPTLEAARASNKVICLIPSRDGQTYEMRRSELGEFIAPKHKITEFSEVRAGFRPALPRIPQELLRAIIGFFRSQMESGAEFEALVRIYWDRKEQKFIPFVPKQRVTKDRVTVRLTDEDLPDDTRYLYYADIHSHNSMKAVFSAIDDQDERGTRLYLVIGRLDRFFPEISARISCGGSFVPIEPSLVLEGVDSGFPAEWSGKVIHQLPELPEPPSAHFAGVRSFLGGLLGGAG